ncbi:MAG: ScpA family protein [Nitriliruptorales bacterium]
MSAAVDQGQAETSVEQASSAAVPLVESEAASGYHVRIEGFEGPFDLLLQLIARRRLEISEVDLADITGEFLVHLARNRDGTFDLETATHFLVVAATLVELKAARLLPVDGEEQLDKILQEARDVLYARLLEYRAFRELSGLLAELLERNEAYAGREVPLEQHLRDFVPPATGSIEPATLAELAAIALSPRLQPRVSIAHIHHTSLTIAEAAASLVARIRSHGQRVTFGSLVEGCSRSEQVVHFMALLELYKMGRVELRQDDGWAPLEVACRETACEGFPLRGPSVPTSP